MNLLITYKEIRTYKTFGGFEFSWRKKPPRKATLFEFFEWMLKNGIEQASYGDAPLVEQPGFWQSFIELNVKEVYSCTHIIVILALWPFIFNSVWWLQITNIVGLIILGSILKVIINYWAFTFKGFKRFFKPKPKEIQNGN